MENNYLKRLLDIRFKISISSPFMGFIAQHTMLYLKDDVKTAATNGKDIYFSPTFMDTLSDVQLQFVFMHELLHIILMHPIRKKSRDHHKFNIACDIVINDYLHIEGYQYEKLPIIRGIQFNIKRSRRETAESVYEKLPFHLSEKTIDMHDMWDDAVASGIEEYIQDLFKKAYEQNIFPDNIVEREMDQAVYHRLFKRQSIVAKHVERYVKKHTQDYQFDRIDPRYEEVFMPDFIPSGEMLFGIWLVIDVSYSMQKNDFEHIINDLHALIKKYQSVSIDVSLFSNIVTEPMHIKRFDDLLNRFKKLETTGGTDFDIIFKAYQTHFKRNKQPQMIVIYTDGLCHPPKQKNIPKVDILWFITVDYDPNLPGKVVVVDK